MGFKASTGNRSGIAAFMIEFGAVQDFDKSVDEINRVTTLADSYLHSWSYWQFKWFDDFTTRDKPAYIEAFYNGDGSLQTNKVKAMARSYTYATCGRPVSQLFDPSTGKFTYTYYSNNECQGQKTELFLSEEFYYPNGILCGILGCDGCQLQLISMSQPIYYEVYVPEGIEENTLITLEITTVTANEKSGSVINYIQY